MEQETPCTKVCIIDPRTALCLGCGRNVSEIAQWSAMTSSERRAVMAMLPQRMLDAGMQLPAPMKP